MEPLPSVEDLLPQLRRLGIELPTGTVRVSAFGDSAELSAELLALVRDGRKRGSAGLLWAYEADSEPIARTGDIVIVVDHRNAPSLVTRITEVEVLPFNQVAAEFAAREGEGDGSLEYWREAHWAFFSRECRRIGREPSDTMPVVCNSFEVLHVIPDTLSIAMHIEIDDLSRPQVHALLQEHLDNMYELSPPESVHALDLTKLRSPDITFWTVWDGALLLGCGALKQLTPTHGEVKSMRTPKVLRGKGAGRAVLAHIITEARSRGYRRLSLETGSQEAFEPARNLYRSVGFTACGPFADYTNDPNSFFMSLELG